MAMQIRRTVTGPQSQERVWLKRRSGLDLVIMAALGVALGGVLTLFVRSAGPGSARSAALDRASAPGPGRSVRTSVPSLLAQPGGARSLELDPRAPGYDPTVFSEVTPLRELFAREPRNEPWARPVESYLSGKIDKEVSPAFPGLRLKGVECRTAICKISFEAAGGATINHMKLQQVLALLYSPAAGGHGGEHLSFVVAYRGDVAWLSSVPGDDPGALFPAIEQRRREMIAALRENQAKGTPRRSFHLVNLEELAAP